MISKPKYVVEIFLTEDDRHTSYIVRGLLDLEKAGFICLNFKSMPGLFKNRIKLENELFDRTNKGYPWCPELLITSTKQNIQKRIGIDLQDWDNLFSHHSFENCLILYKRALTKKQKLFFEKIKPNFIRAFGPNLYFEIKDKRYLKNIMISKAKQSIVKAISNPQKIPSKIKEIFLKLRFNNKINKKIIIVNKNALFSPLEKEYIFFQVQYYNWENDHSKVINDYRANIIRTLKNNFGEQFYGGMWFVNEVNESYRDCITNVDTNKETYKQFYENASVVISTNGFGNSVPWKLIEFLRDGLCIVTEQNKHLFQKPLTDTEVTFFQNTDDMIESCKQLLNDKKLNKLKRQNAFKYYEKNLKPSVSMKKVIESVFS